MGRESVKNISEGDSGNRGLDKAIDLGKRGTPLPSDITPKVESSSGGAGVSLIISPRHVLSHHLLLGHARAEGNKYGICILVGGFKSDSAKWAVRVTATSNEL